MHRALRAAVVAALGSVPLFFAGHTLADTTVIGDGFAADCSAAAKAASARQTARADALRACDMALQNEVLSEHDLAATHVNRGVLFLASARYPDARRDFDAAARIEPGLGEARYAEGIAEINRGLALNASEPEKAYYNRALAEERQSDLKSAYFDYQKALELKPGWAMAQSELARFHVVQQ